MGEVLQVLALVDDGGDDPLHVVGLVRAAGHDVAKLDDLSVGILGLVESRRRLEVVRRKKRQQVADVVEARLLVGGDERRHAGPGGVAHGAAELLEGHLLARDGLHDVGSGDEHVARLVHHEDEVGHRRRVHGAAGARTEDHADLRDDAGCEDIAVEYAAVAVKRHDALLDARATRVVETDDRHPDRQRQIHDLVDLLGVRLAECSPEDPEILAEHADAPPVDHPEAGDHPVGVGPRALEPHAVSTVTHEKIHLLEGVLVQQVVDPLTGRHLAL